MVVHGTGTGTSGSGSGNGASGSVVGLLVVMAVVVELV